MLKKLSKVLFLIWCLTLSVNVLFAQDPDPICENPDDPNCQPTVPLDGGASALVVAAAVYGFKKIKDQQKRKKE